MIRCAEGRARRPGRADVACDEVGRGRHPGGQHGERVEIRAEHALAGGRLVGHGRGLILQEAQGCRPDGRGNGDHRRRGIREHRQAGAAEIVDRPASSCAASRIDGRHAPGVRGCPRRRVVARFHGRRADTPAPLAGSGAAMSDEAAAGQGVLGADLDALAVCRRDADRVLFIAATSARPGRRARPSRTGSWATRTSARRHVGLPERGPHALRGGRRALPNALAPPAAGRDDERACPCPSPWGCAPTRRASIDMTISAFFDALGHLESPQVPKSGVGIIDLFGRGCRPRSTGDGVINGLIDGAASSSSMESGRRLNGAGRDRHRRRNRGARGVGRLGVPPGRSSSRRSRRRPAWPSRQRRACPGR